MSEEVVGGSTILIGGDAEGFITAIGSAIQAADRMEKEVTSKVSRAVQALAGVTLPDIGKLASQDKAAIVDLGREMARLQGGELGLLKFNAAAKGVNDTLANALIGNIQRLKDEAKQTENLRLFSGFEKSLENAAGLGEVERRINALTASMERLTGAERKAAEQALQLARSQEQASRTQTDNDNYVAALARRTNAIGKTFAQLQLEEVALLKQEAAMRGVSAQAAPYITKIEAAALATQKMGVSAGQTRQALAQLPAQFTDIFTSLAGGINPLLVLVQQGGQIKDSFGGIGNALKGIGEILTPVRIGLAGIAGAVVALALAYKQGSTEQDAYAKGLILSGNAAGATVGQLNEMAKAISGSIGTQGKAAEVLAQLAAAGTVAAGGLQKAADAAIRMERSGGQAASETAKQIAELGKDPLQAVLKLNDGINFLTVSTFNQIKAFADVGKTAEAAALAQAAYADSVTERASKLEERLGTLQKAWRLLGDVAKGAWDRMLDVGRPETVEDKIAKAKATLDKAANQDQLGLTGEGRRAFGAQPVSKAEIEAARELLAKSEKQVETERALAGFEATRAKASQNLVEANKLIDASLEHQKQLQNDLAKSKETFDKIREGAAGDPAALKLIDAQEKRSLSFIQKTSAFQQEMWAKDAAVAQNTYQLVAEKIRAQLEQIPLKAKEGLLSPIEAIEKSGALRVELLKAESTELQKQYALELQKLNNAGGQEAALGRIKVVQAQITSEAEKTNQAVRSEVFEKRQKAEKEYEDERKKNREDIQKFNEDVRKSTLAFASTLEQSAQALADNNKLLETEATLIGASDKERAISVALLQVEITRRKQLADLAKNEKLDPEERAKFAQQIEDQAVQARAQAQAKIYLDAYQKVYDDISSGLADALMGGAKTAADYIKNLFKSMVLKPIIQTQLAPVTSAITNAITGGKSGSGVGFSFGGGFGGSSGLSNYGIQIGNTDITASDVLSGAGYLSAALSASRGQWGQAIGSAVGSYILPGIGSLIGSMIGSAADTFFSGGAGTPHMGGYVQSNAAGLFTDITKQQGGIQQSETQSAVKALVGPLTSALNDTAKAFGKDAAYGIRAVFESDAKDASSGLFHVLDSAGNKLAGLVGSFDAVSKLNSDPTKGFAEFSTQAASAVRDALLAIDLPKWASDQLKALGDSVSVDALNNTVKAISEAQTAIVKLTGDLKPMAGLMGRLGAMSSDAVYALSKVAGGLDVLTSSLQTYYQAFYSDAEKSADSLAQIGATLKDVGINSVPNTREAFRQLVEAQDLTTESGQKAFTTLLSVSGALDKLVTAAEQAQIALDKAVETNFAKFQTPAQQAQAKYENIAGSLVSAGVGGFGNILSAIIGASKDDVYAFAQAFLSVDTNSVAAKTAVVEAAGALFDLKDAAEKAADAAQKAAKAAADEAAAKLKSIYSGADAIVGDFLKGSELAGYKASRIQQTLAEGGIDVTIAGILGATKDEVLALWKAVGVDGKQAILNAYGAFKDLEEILHGVANAVKEYRATTLADAIEKARLQTLKPEDRIASLKATERNLFAQLPTAEDPIAVAEKLQGVILTRISEETTLRDKLNATTKDALNKQIDALKNMRGLADDIAQFTGSITFSDLSPLSARAQVGSAQSLFESTLAQARDGSTFAQGNLVSNARAYLEEAASAFASGPAYVAIFDKVNAALKEFATTAGADVSPQLKALQDQVDALDDISGYSKDMLDALLSIDSALGGRFSLSGAAATTGTPAAGTTSTGTATGTVVSSTTSSAPDQVAVAMTIADLGAIQRSQTDVLQAIQAQVSAVAVNTGRLQELVNVQGAQVAILREGFTQVIKRQDTSEDTQQRMLSVLELGPVPT